MLHERSEFLANSMWRILNYLLINQWEWSTSNARQLSVNLPNWLFVISSFLFILWMFNFRPKRWRNASIVSKDAQQTLWQTLQAISVLYLLVGSFWFQHWYILWVLAPAALLPDSRFTRLLLPWLVFGALSSNAGMDFMLNTVLKESKSVMKYILPVIMIWGPILFATFLSKLIQLWEAKKASSAVHRPIVQD